MKKIFIGLIIFGLSFIATASFANSETDAVLLYAVHEGNVKNAEEALKNEANPNITLIISGKETSPVIVFAALENNFAMVKLLLKYGAFINAQTDSGYTALMVVAGFGSNNMLKLLLDRGADMTKKDKDGKTALYFAWQLKREDNMNLLRNQEILNEIIENTSKK